MGMPITVEVIDASVTPDALEKIFSYFKAVDEQFSVFKETSEISQINRGLINEKDCSEAMKMIFSLCEKTKWETDGYFDIGSSGKLNPSGLVKGWAILNASKLLSRRGFSNHYVEAGGDIQVQGNNAEGEPWKIGIRNPFDTSEIIKVVTLKNKGIATSGTYIRGQHIYNPKRMGVPIIDIVSLTVIGPNVYEADRFATPAFAMGKDGIKFIESLEGFEGYMVDANGTATLTSGLEKYTLKNQVRA